MRLFGSANFILKNRKTSEGVRQVERPPVFVATIDRKGFDVARFRQQHSTSVIVGVAQMPDSVCQFQGFVRLTQAGDGKFTFEYVGVVADAGHLQLLPYRFGSS